MLVVRPAEIEDIDPLFSMIQDAELGLSTLKISKDRLTERIEDSARAFDKENARPRGQPYVFVMEDLRRDTQTTIRIQDFEASSDLPAAEFTKSALKSDGLLRGPENDSETPAAISH